MWMVKGALLPLEGRLRRVMSELDESWQGTAPKPQWRVDQEESPSKWNVQMKLDEADKL